MDKKRSYLLDTMAVLWLAFLSKRLPRAVCEAVLDQATHLRFSAVSLWEIGLKMSVGGYRDFKLPDNWDFCIPEGLRQQNIILLDVGAVHCRRIQELPFHHRDPFDRMLVAQCQIEKMTILSSDAMFESYEIDRIW